MGRDYLALFRAGLIAGAIQGITTIVVTPLMLAYADSRSSAGEPDQQLPISTISLLSVTYLLVATGVALTRHRYLAATSRDIRDTSRRRPTSDRNYLAGTLAACLSFAAMGCAAFALQPAPAAFIELDYHIGAHAAGPIVWAALMSVLAAAFGANAHAAANAMQ